jgi:transcriptional regulator with XRE-family HTH domain
MEAAEQQGLPAICLRIRKTRRELFDRWAAENPNEQGMNPYSQEQVASRVGITRNAYRAFERRREPSLARLRQIAAALGLDDDYFSPRADRASVTARLEAEADRYAEMNDRLQALIEALQALLAEQASQPTPGDNE